MSDNLLQIEGNDFVAGGRKTVLRGLNIGSWLNLEHFMIGMPGADQRIRSEFASVFGKEASAYFFDRLRENFVNEDDFKYFKMLGINILRLPFNYHFFLDDQRPGEYMDEGFKYLDFVIALCEKYEIYVVLDLHTSPGGQNPDWHSDNITGIAQFWQYKVFRDQMTGLWRHVADHYKDCPYVAYDVLNEPFFIPDKNILFSFYDEVISAIREADKKHIIFLEGDHFAMDFSGFPKSADPQVALSFHFYPHVWNKDIEDINCDRKTRKKALKSALDPMVKARDEYGGPLWCGEFGWIFEPGKADFYAGMLEDTLGLFEANNISWTVWSYKDSRAMGLVFPKPGTAWIELTGKIRSKWSMDIETQQAYTSLRKIAAMYFQPLENKLEYELQFRLRAMFQEIYISQILRPELNKLEKGSLEELADSFLFKNCETQREIESLIKRYTQSYT